MDKNCKYAVKFIPCLKDFKFMKIIIKISVIALFTNLAISFGTASSMKNDNTTLLITIESELQHFVKIVRGKYYLPITEYEINKNILTAALMFDALGAYGIRSKSSSGKSSIFSTLTKNDSLNLIPYLIVFTKKKGNTEELAILYAAILEANGIATALLHASEHLFVLFDTGVHKKYSGALSRNITSYVIRNGHVWFSVDVALLGKPFHKAWQTTFGKVRGETHDLIPTVQYVQDKKIKRATIFSSSINKTQINKLFLKDKKYFENDLIKPKLDKVTAIKQENDYQAERHFNDGLRYLDKLAYDNAIIEFEKAEKFGGDAGKALFLIAKAYSEKKDYQNMKKTGIQLVKYSKRDPRGYKILGFAYYNSGSLEIGNSFFLKAKFLENHLLT